MVTSRTTTKRRQQQVIVALIEGSSRVEAAKVAGCTDRAVYKWFESDQEFIKLWNQTCNKVFSQALRTLQARAGKAVNEITRLIECGETPPAVSLQAARTVLEYGIKGKELFDLCKRIEELEKSDTEKRSRNGSFNGNERLDRIASNL